MSLRARFPLDGLAARFAILLALALVAANLIAATVLYIDRLQQENALRIEREVERIVSLVPAIEAAPAGLREAVAREASTRVSRLSVDPRPIVEDMPTAPRSVALSDDLATALDDREVRAAIMVRPSDNGRRGETVALSIRLRGEDATRWLNSVSREDRRAAPPGLPGDVMFLILGISLAAVLGVALVFLRRLTRPLNDLAAAARAAGQGDRTARVKETGPRELREASAAFNDMQDRIARFDAERMRTLASVGHDLRTPITSLRIRAEMLDEDEAKPMIRTLDEMTVMADGLVAYARGAGDGEATQEINLGQMLARLCEDRGASYQEGRAMRIVGRPVALGRAVGNLIDNAMRYGDVARVSLAREGDDAVISVEDDGPGIPPERLSQVLEPFVRGEDSRSLETGGAGLGLAIARNIMASHGGSLVLQNRPEGGLRATVRLPLEPVG
ncbi:ATP-binding protein [uncultured Marivita sp.]|uniref:ATP-binding protein n=1 Tax=uncultured Marivita sp. TaxID=888080 RepID=UPI00262A8D11|nr:ATP-binding protein [uncultured Marivita sp.]